MTIADLEETFLCFCPLESILGNENVTQNTQNQAYTT